MCKSFYGSMENQKKYDDGSQILQNLRFRLIDSSEERFDAIGLVRSIGDRRSLELLP